MRNFVIASIITAAVVAALSQSAQSAVSTAYIACLSMTATSNTTLTSQMNTQIANGYQPVGGLAVATNGTLVQIGVLMCK